MSSSVFLVVMFMLLLILPSSFHLTASHTSPSMLQPLCHDDESSALLHFKESLVIDKSASSNPYAYSKVASWKVEGETDDCCLWDGVECDIDSGYVIGLNLSSSCLYGSIDSNSSLFHLVHLRRLNLDDNNFNNSKIPSEIRNLPSLIQLNLSIAGFSGQIPSEILELPKLVSLSLIYNSLELRKPGLRDLAEALPNLELLHLSGVNISSKVPATIANLTSLSSLFLRNCGLYGEFPVEIFRLPNLRNLTVRYNPYLTGRLPDFPWGNQLEKLVLRATGFSGHIPNSIGNLKSMELFDAGYCNFSGHLPSGFLNLTQLTELYLMYNQLSGQIPSWIGNLTQLVVLELSVNRIHCLVPESISRLQNLQTLDLGGNLLSGTLKLDLLLMSKYLLWLQLTDNGLSLVYNHNATATLPKLEFLGLGNCNLSGVFPHFLRGQNNLGYLELGDNKIEGKIPQWFMNLGTQTFWYLGLGGNLLTGLEQPFDTLPWNNLRYLNLSFNELQGALPIPPPSIFIYAVANNKLSGEMPPAICNLTFLLAFGVSNNNLNGTLPKCLGSLGNSATVLVLRNNSLSGEIPETFSSRCTLRAVDFGVNEFEGKIPRSLANCTMLQDLNLEENKIDDIFPSWLGVLPDLRILILRSNGLHGEMGNPKTSAEFPKLRIIDLSNNSLRGKLPLEYFRNWNSMKEVHKEHLEYMQANISFDTRGNRWYNTYFYRFTMTNKGVMMLYAKIQDFLVAVDLSSNSFEGEVPGVIGDLKELNLLNLSNNLLSGFIPPSFGNLKALESLDLSQNKLTGEIPQQLAQLTFLEFFNLSHNFLSGPIPRGNQFDTFDNSSFVANSGLCGKPLSKNCGNIEDSPPKPSASEGPETFFEFGWKVVVIGYAGGMVVGVILGCIINTRKYEWYVQSAFARRQRKARRARRRLSRS